MELLQMVAGGQEVLSVLVVGGAIGALMYFISSSRDNIIIKRETENLNNKIIENNKNLENNPNDFWELCRKGTFLLAEHKYEEAKKYFEYSYNIESTYETTLKGLIVCNYKNDNIEACQKYKTELDALIQIKKSKPIEPFTVEELKRYLSLSEYIYYCFFIDSKLELLKGNIDKALLLRKEAISWTKLAKQFDLLQYWENEFPLSVYK